MASPSSTQVRASAHVDAARLQARLDALARIGATAHGGVNRQALSHEDALAQAEMTRWGAAIGLQAARDAAGNFFLRLPGRVPAAAPVLSGSHLDSQPTGGRFDGVYGVVAAFEAVQALVETGVVPERPIDVVAWMNEEGSRFAPGMMGSAVFAGERTLAETEAATDAGGTSVGTALRQVQATLAQMQTEGLPAIAERALGGAVHAYVEAHIEQGPLLERMATPVGVVTGIQGKHTWRIEVQGEAAHAGTATRAERKDALLAALAMVQAMAAAFHDAGDVTRFTVGRFEVTPNAPSVVPSRVVFSIDLRHPDTTELQRMADLVAALCDKHRGPCEVAVHLLSAADSLSFPAALQARIRDTARALGVPTLDLPSAAGHDARYLHGIAPAAMLFVPCHLGITHNEAEYAQPEDLYQGARVLADVLQALACEQGAP
ncbi:M20 family metallo-hydrolase [Xylophilus sp. GW821-FHT01B05]